MRLFTSVFCLSHWSVRAPALLGAAIYIVAAYLLVRRCAQPGLLRSAMLLCLVYNPLIMDHLVAARGYSLALAFLMALLAVAAETMGRGPALPWSLPACCALCSALAALSFCANFSFALVDAAVLGFFAWWAFGRAGGPDPPRVLAAALLPGLAITALLAGSVLLTWPRNQFVYGAYSLGEAGNSLVKSSFFELNPYLVNPLLLRCLELLRSWILPLVGVACLSRIASLGPPRQWSASWRWGMLVAAAAVTAATGHWLLFQFAHLLLPKDRTAIWVAPLCVLFAGALAGMPAAGRAGQWTRRALAASLLVMGSYFVACLRLTYFREWQFNADVQTVYSVLSYYNHRYQVTGIFPQWRYVAALNFYRSMSGRESIPNLVSHLPPYEGGHQAYVMYWPLDEEFIRQQGLKVVYFSRLSDAVVAIRPDVEDPPVAAASSRTARPGPR